MFYKYYYHKHTVLSDGSYNITIKGVRKIPLLWRFLGTKEIYETYNGESTVWYNVDGFIRATTCLELHLAGCVSWIKYSKLDENKREIPFNINYGVKVKLTERGRDIYYHRYDELNKLKSHEIKPSYPEVDEDGYFKTALWDLMNIFGSHFRLDEKPPFSTEIILIKK